MAPDSSRGGRAETPDETPTDYDPEQSIAVRRDIQRNMRNIHQRVRDNADELLAPTTDNVTGYMRDLNVEFGRTRQTTEAAVDSVTFLQLAEVAFKRSTLLTSGNVVNGLDVDEFVSKCVTYMRHGRGILDDNAAGLSSTQRQRRVPRGRGAIGDEDDDEVGDDGDELNWAHLGRYACVPHVRRPALPGFLLGPLSVEKKVRKITKRTERLRINNLEEIRPQVLNVSDIAKNEKTDLTAICTKILARLQDVQAELQERIGEEEEDMESMSDAEVRAALLKIGLSPDGGVDLMRFVVNPKSFGQTIENMFYVSFLIRDGRVGLVFDQDELPSLVIIKGGEEAETSKKSSRNGSQKNQAVMEMDVATWKEIIKTCNLKEPLIEHRDEHHQQISGSRGWYS